MITAHDIFFGFVAPLLIAGVLGGLLGRGALGVGAGFLAGYLLVFGRMKLPPANDFEWIVPLVAGVSLVATVFELLSYRWSAAWGVVMAGGYLLVERVVAPVPLVGMLVVGWLWWISWDQAVRRDEGAWAGLVMTGVAGVTNLVLMLSSSQLLGQIGMALTGALAGVWLVGIFRKRMSWRGVGLVYGFGVFGLLLNGKEWAELTWVNFGLILLAHNAVWLGEIKSLTGWKRSVVRVGGVIVIASVAVALAVVAFQKAQQSTGAEYY